MRLIFQALFLLVPLSGLAAPPERLKELDALYARRDEAAALQSLDLALRESLKAEPDDYELLWRASRARQWVAEGARDERLKRQAGKEAWDLGDRARKVNPARPEGHLHAAAGLGIYAQGIGIVKALRQGLEGQFLERVDAAIKADRFYDLAGPLLARGRYHYELPWPKRDLEKSAALLREALQKYPHNLRAQLYLAETLLKDGEPQEARGVIRKVMEGSIAYDPPEGRRAQQWAKTAQAAIEEKLK